MPVSKKPGPKKKKTATPAGKKITVAKRGPKPKVQSVEPESQPSGNVKKTVATTAGLTAALDAINGKHGIGSITRLNSAPALDIQRISSGHWELDHSLLGGSPETGYGFPRGRITEISGWESAGKTTLSDQAIAECQAIGLVAAKIDVEHATDRAYIELIGVDTDELLFSQPDSGEQALDILETLVKSGQLGLIVLDSVAAMATKAELEGEVGDSHVGQLSRLMSLELKKINPVINKSNAAVLMINQLREKIGVFGHGEKKTTPGGRALKFYASIRLEVTKVGELPPITINGEPIVPGNKVKIKTIKNKVGPALRTIQIELRFPIKLGNGKIQSPGFDGVRALLDAAIDAGLMVGGGNKSYVFPDKTTIKGSQAARDYLKSKPELMKSLTAQVTND